MERPNVDAAVQVVRHGPTGWPERTLGWASMEWACEWLQQPDGANAGDPWAFTEEQARFVAWWFSVDERGRWIYTGGVLRRMKGWGKDPLASVVAAIEFVGPCRFDGWNPDGEPRVKTQPAAWVQIAAVSKEQTRNTMVLFPSLFSKKAIAEYGIDIGKEVIYAEGGSRQIQAVTSSPKTLEGARSTLVIENEPQHWLESNDGTEMDKAIRRNTAKVGGRRLGITNAHRIGENSVAEADWKKYLADGDDGDLLYDSIEASDVLGERGKPKSLEALTDDELRACLMAARGDSVWVPIDRLMIDARDERDSEVYRRRFYLNQIRQETSTWITASEWAGVERDEAVAEGAVICLGFDGARFQDTTALVGTVVATGYQWVIGFWSRPDNAPINWEVPEAEVCRSVEAAFEQYRVARFYADPYWWQETLSRWHGQWPEQVWEFNTATQTKKITHALKAYETAARTRELGHERSGVYARAFGEHVANAVKREVNIRDEDGERLYSIYKEHKGSPRKIDIAMAAVLSWAARIDAIAAGALDADSVYASEGVFFLG